MTTDYARLISEAEACANHETYAGCLAKAKLLNDLAAAVRELAPPEGWRWTEARKGDHPVLKDPTVAERDGKWQAEFQGRTIGIFPTASAAMAALNGEKK